MKKIFLTFAILGAILASCDQENVGAIFDNGGIDYVAVGTTDIDASIGLTLANNYTAKFPLHRSDLSINGTTAEVELNGGEGLFALVSNTITFADGEGLAYAEIKASVPADQLDPATAYSFELTVTGENASELYNVANFSAQLLLSYTTLGEGSFNSEFYAEAWSQDVEKAEGLEIYKAPSLYEAGKDILFIVVGDSVFVGAQKAWNYDADYGDVLVEGKGVKSIVDGKTVFTVMLDHNLPDVSYSFGVYTEVLTLP